MDPLATLSLIWACYAFVFGACIGSFLNVVILRLPRGETLGGRSHCRCGALIKWHDNIPILGWIFLRGRARCCGAPFSVRYPAVELITGLLFLGLWQQYEPTTAAAYALFASLMVVAAGVDLDTMEIPDTTSIGGFILGVWISMFLPTLQGVDGDLFVFAAFQSGLQALINGLVCSALILWIGILSSALLKKETMGFGDVKLMGAIGAFCGWQGGLFSIFGGATLGLICLALWQGLRLVLPKRAVQEPFVVPVSAEEGYREAFELAAKHPDEWELEANSPIPFGPMLAGGALVYLILLREPVDAFFAELQALILG
ncbi:MAG: prepilin peptidase [Verrucomicrobiota bacterium JB022]|nr:prepilin peptidase [Verrucomicrobiota bacterium JB022]